MIVFVEWSGGDLPIFFFLGSGRSQYLYFLSRQSNESIFKNK